MSSTITIRNYNQLLAFIEDQDLNRKQICQLLQEALQMIADETKPREVLIDEIREFISKYEGTGMKPIFLGLPSLDVVQ